MKEKIHEYDIKAFFRFDSSLVIEAVNEKEAEKIRIRFINEAKKLGLSLEEILEDLQADWNGGNIL